MEIDPKGSELGKPHHIKKRKYHNPGPHYAWHCVGYMCNKLKPYGFAFHGCIGGWSHLTGSYKSASSKSPNSAIFALTETQHVRGQHRTSAVKFTSGVSGFWFCHEVNAF